VRLFRVAGQPVALIDDQLARALQDATRPDDLGEALRDLSRLRGQGRQVVVRHGLQEIIDSR